MKKLNVAIIGQGRSGKDIHGKYYLSADNRYYTVKYVVEADERRRRISEKRYPDCRTFADYTAGIMLLDLEDPSRVKGMCKTPLLVPELPHEAEQGYRQNVIFPGGMILEENGEVKIYYGAADTVECVATARVEDLVALCSEPL